CSEWKWNSASKFPWNLPKSIQEWVSGLEVFLRGDIKEKTLAFSVYDLNEDGLISRDEINKLINLSLSCETNNEDIDDIIRDLVDYSFKRLDVNHDGRIDYEDFLKVVKVDLQLKCIYILLGLKK
ncbi:unnamed protein product, partial [Rodentolepis nana]|uniref:Calglandulin n=1 Tax=Rodentolepis nana TaxID=102285 RepID=A0A0R3TKF8_RODNA